MSVTTTRPVPRNHPLRALGLVGAAALYAGLFVVLPDQTVLIGTAAALLILAAVLASILALWTGCGIFNLLAPRLLTKNEGDYLWAGIYLRPMRSLNLTEAELARDWETLTGGLAGLLPVRGWRFGWRSPRQGAAIFEAQDAQGQRVLLHQDGTALNSATGFFVSSSPFAFHGYGRIGLYRSLQLDHEWAPFSHGEARRVLVDGLLQRNLNLVTSKCAKCDAVRLLVHHENALKFALYPLQDQPRFINPLLMGLFLLRFKPVT